MGPEVKLWLTFKSAICLGVKTSYYTSCDTVYKFRAWLKTMCKQELAEIFTCTDRVPADYQFKESILFTFKHLE